jgi:ATP adenylyltransferase
MNNIWAPWRMEYVKSPKENTCVFCDAPKNNDPLILREEPTCFAIMNRFPYTTGHCMVAPYRHVGDLSEIDDQEFIQIMSLVKTMVNAVRDAMNPQGFNVGCNIGSVAGAGIADHLHIHIVPRWDGDTNFMPVLSHVNMISEHIEKTRDKILRHLP